MSDNNSIRIERVFNAPIELIWDMWTHPDHYKNWYGPQGATVPVAEMDVRIGGKRLVCMEMQTPKGSMKMWTTGEYREIIINNRLVFTESMSDENGNIMSASAMGMPEDFPTTTEVIVELEDLGNQTKMIMTHKGMSDQGASGGWNQAFTKMEAYIDMVISKK